MSAAAHDQIFWIVEDGKYPKITWYFLFPFPNRDVYPFLERLCLEGTRAESKSAVSAIAALASTSDYFWFSKLCKVRTNSFVGIATHILFVVLIKNIYILLVVG